jgi:hypothetical protein
MKYKSFNRELEKSTAQVLDVFNNIEIDRKVNNTIQKSFLVPCVYGNRSRVLKSMENRDKTVELPLICIYMGNFVRDNARVYGIHDGLMQQDGSSYTNIKKNTPIPVTITYNLEVIAKFQEDLDQILSNFIVWFNPSIYVVLTNPINNKPLKAQVIWDGNINYTYPNEIDKNAPYRITATTTFTFKTWIFPGVGADDYEPKKILRINFNPCIQWDEGIGRLGAWYEVPTYMGFNAYTENILCGFIKLPNYDLLQISAGLSGYWHDISGTCTGLSLGINLSADPCYLVTDNGGLLLLTDTKFISRGMAAIGLTGYTNYLASTISGDLSGYGTHQL